MKVAEQILPFFLLVIVIIITARFAVFSGYLHTQKVELRKTSLLQKNVQVKKLTFSQEELFVDHGPYKWKEHNKELVIDGCYHEVISVQKTDKGFVVAVIEDKTENELLKQFFDKNKAAQETANSLLQLLQVQYPAPHAMVFSTPNIQIYTYYQTSQPTLCLGFSSLPLLPPRAC